MTVARAPSDPLGSLLARWREDCTVLRRRGATVHADVLEGAVADVEAALTLAGSEAVTLAEGARLSGYSADALGRLVRAGRIPNLGRPHAPRVRVADLPRKPHSSGAPRQTARPRLSTEGGR